MPSQLGRTLLIRIGDGQAPAETFHNLCGLKTRDWDIAPSEIDTTIPNCSSPGGPVQKTSRPGMVNRIFSGAGTFISGAPSSVFVEHARTATIFNAEIVIPGVGVEEGPFWASVKFSGDMENDMSFEATFNAAGPLTFTAEPP